MAKPGTPLQDIARYAAGLYGLNQERFVQQLTQESGFGNPTSSAGAAGVAQFMPGTWRSVWQSHPELGQHYGDLSDPSNRMNQEASIFAAAALMSDLMKQGGGSYRNALIGYNAGPGYMNKPYDQLPAETQRYLNILDPTLGGAADSGGNGWNFLPDVGFASQPEAGPDGERPYSGGIHFVTGPGGRVFAYDEYGPVGTGYDPGTGETGADSRTWRPGEYELEQGSQALDAQSIANQLWYWQAQAGNDQQSIANDLYLGQLGATNDAQQNADWYSINQRQNELTQREQDLAKQKSDADRAVDWYRAQGEDQNAKIAESHQWSIAQAQLQLDNDRAQWQRDSDAMQYGLGLRGQDVTMRGQDINAMVDAMNAAINQQGQYMDYNLGLGNLALGGAGVETDRYRALTGAQLDQQGNALDYMGMNLDAQSQFNNALINKYQADIAAFRAVGDEQGAQETNQRLIAAQNQNAALEWMRIMSDNSQSSTGLGGAASAATQLALGLADLGQRQNENLVELAANPRDWVQLQYAMGNGLGDILAGISPGSQSVANIGDQPTLGAGFDQLMSQIGQNSAQPYVEQASSIIGRLADWSSDPTHGGQMPSLQDILNIGAVPGAGGGMPMPQLQSPDLQGPLQYQFPGLDLTPQWNSVPQFPGMNPIQDVNTNLGLPAYAGMPDLYSILSGMPNPFGSQMNIPQEPLPQGPYANTGAPPNIPIGAAPGRPTASVGGAPPPQGGLPPAVSPTVPSTPVNPAGPYDPNDPQHIGPGQYDMSHPGSTMEQLPDGTPYRRDPSGGGEIDKPGYEPGLLLSNEQQDILNRARKNTKGYTGPDWHGTPKKVTYAKTKFPTKRTKPKDTPQGYSPAAQAILDRQKKR